MGFIPHKSFSIHLPNGYKENQRQAQGRAKENYEVTVGLFKGIPVS
jgi:hypothetical protein